MLGGSSTFPDKPEVLGLSAAPESDASDPLLRLVAGAEPGHSAAGGGGASMPLPGELIDGKYRLQRLLGRGGMGWVFEAVHLQTEKTVALKYLRPDLPPSKAWLSRFAREARAAGKIDHPNVIRIYDVGGVGPGMYIVMEYLRGETLRSRLQRGPIRHEEAIPLLLAVMRGVAEAHRLGVVHRDLKPDNIFLCAWPNGHPDVAKVLDFGVSRIVDPASDLALDRTSLGDAGGTPLYMPLEQLQRSAADTQVDVYALGVVLYEALTASHPFEASTRDGLVAALSNDRPRPLPRGVHPHEERLDEILLRALARHPHDRYASVSEFAAALERLDAPPAVQVSARSRSFRAWLLPAVFAVFALLPAVPRRIGAARAPEEHASSAAAPMAMAKPIPGVDERVAAPLCDDPQASTYAGSDQNAGEPPSSTPDAERGAGRQARVRSGPSRPRPDEKRAAERTDSAQRSLGRALTLLREDF